MRCSVNSLSELNWEVMTLITMAPVNRLEQNISCFWTCLELVVRYCLFHISCCSRSFSIGDCICAPIHTCKALDWFQPVSDPAIVPWTQTLLPAVGFPHSDLCLVSHNTGLSQVARPSSRFRQSFIHPSPSTWVCQGYFSLCINYRCWWCLRSQFSRDVCAHRLESDVVPHHLTGKIWCRGSSSGLD